VPFGEGNVDFVTVFQTLKQIGYSGNFIIQGARAPDGDHAGILKSYASLVEGQLNDF